jgi:hypothetical protein
MDNYFGQPDYGVLAVRLVLMLGSVCILWGFIYAAVSSIKKKFVNKGKQADGQNGSGGNPSHDNDKQIRQNAARQHNGDRCDQATDREMELRAKLRQHKAALRDDVADPPFPQSV